MIFEAIDVGPYKDLTVTTHAYDMARSRNIGAYMMKKAITEGELTNKGFEPRHDVYRLELPVSLLVAVDSEKSNIITVYYDDEEGGLKGALP